MSGAAQVVRGRAPSEKARSAWHFLKVLLVPVVKDESGAMTLEPRGRRNDQEEPAAGVWTGNDKG